MSCYRWIIELTGLQTREQNDLLDRAVENFLSLIAPRINLLPAMKAMEWLVRRFQIHVHNAETMLLAMLPYYSSSVFMRVLDVIPVPLPQAFSFLTTPKKTYQNPSRNLLIRALATDSQLCELVSSYIIKCIKDHREYHNMLAFWSSVSIWTLVSMKENRANSEDIVDRFLPHIAQVIPLKKSPDAQIASYMILAVLGSQVTLKEDVLSAAIKSIVSNWSKSSVKSGLACITQLVKNSEIEVFEKPVWDSIDKVKSVDQEILGLSEKYNIGKFVQVWASSVFAYAPEKLAPVQKVVSKVNLSESELKTIVNSAVNISLGSDVSDEVKGKLGSFFEALLGYEENGPIIRSVLEESNSSIESLELALQTSLVVPSLNGESVDADGDANMGDESAVNGVDEGVKLSELTSQLSKLTPSETVSFLSDDASEEFKKFVNLFSQAIHYRYKGNLVEDLKLSDDAVVSFFARLWTGPFGVLARAGGLNYFIEVIEKESAVDFQAIIPCLLAGLSDESEKIRRLCGSALKTLSERYPMKKPKTWAMDTVYGLKDSENVKFMALESVKSLLDAVNSEAQECVLDPDHIITVVNGLYSQKKLGEPLLQFMTSHVLAVKIPQLKTAFLKLVNHSGKNNVKTLNPLLESWFSERDDWKNKCLAYKASFEELEFEVVNVVTNGDKGSIKFLENCIRSHHSDLSELAGKKIIETWSKMRAEAQMSLLRFLTDACVDDEIPYDTLEVLGNINITTTQFTTLLGECQLNTLSSDNAGVAKRRRRSSASASKQLAPGSELASYAEKYLRKITILFELLERMRPESNPALLSQLFSNLGDVHHMGTDSQLPILYTQQVLANCMIYVVDELKGKNVRVDSSAIRTDIIVSCIRSSSSPQVQNRFLLLVAGLASLDREIVLHSVMPIFTFMGANTLRQDDDLSAHVIQQTISQVVPALVAEEDHRQEEIDFLLLSFVAAFSHIPRHRRVKLYGALIKTLGPETSFDRFLVLLGQKFSEAKAKRKSLDAKTLVHFSEAFSKSFTVNEVLSAIGKYLKIVHTVPLQEVDEKDEFAKDKLFTNVAKSSAKELVALKSNMYDFMAGVVSFEDSMRLRILRAVEDGQEDDGSLKEICSRIIEHLLSVRDSEVDKSVNAAVFNILGKFLEILPVRNFVGVVGSVVGSSSDVTVKIHSLQLVKSKFSLELSTDEEAQTAASDAMVMLSNLLKTDGIPNELIQPALEDVEEVVGKFGHTVDPTKELVPLLDTCVDYLTNEDVEVFVSCVAAVTGISLILGARMIGHFAKIVPVVLQRFEEDDHEMVQYATLGLFGGLIKRIPSFMSSSLKKVFGVALKATVALETRQRLLETVVHVMGAKPVIDSLCATWKVAVEANFEAVTLHLDTLDMVVDASSKKDIGAHSVTLVKFLLEAFETRAIGGYNQNDTNRIEAKVIASGLKIVMKLNDKTFRPLFIRMVRWAIEGEGSSNGVDERSRLVIFFKFLVKVLGSLKSIITNYYGYLVDPVCEILTRFSTQKAQDEPLRRSILNSLITSFQYDRDEFWQSQARFDKISKVLVDQIPSIEPGLGHTLVRSIVTLAELCSSPDYNRTINDAICVHLKESCTTNEKIWAIRILKGLYSKLGEEWVTMLPQLVPLIAELLEDEEEIVEDEVRKQLVPVVEEVLGESLDRYLS